MMSFFTRPPDSAEEAKRAAREKLAHTLGHSLEKNLDALEGLDSAINGLLYIVCYMRDNKIEKFTLQPSEKYSIVLSQSGDTYEIQQEQ